LVPLLLAASAGIGAVKKMGQGDGGGGGSPFDMFFGGGGGGGQKQRGRNMDIELPVTLEDLYVGNEKAATVKRRVVCRNCKGKANLPRCAACGPCPKEKKMVHKRAGPGMVVQQEVMVESKEKCKREEKTLEATIEKGMPDNNEITFKYESEQKPGQIPGDVVLKLKTVPHPMFKRSGASLSMRLTIPLRAALLGFETSFKHLDGHTVTIKRTGVTKPGQAIKIKSEGMPKHGTPSEFGDLTITFTVEFPKTVDGELADGLQKLLPEFTAADMKIGQ
jgi:DnaJ-class molecular chaperone